MPLATTLAATGLIPLGTGDASPLTPATASQAQTPSAPTPAVATPTKQDLITVVDRAARLLRETQSLRSEPFYWSKVAELQRIVGREAARTEALDGMIAEFSHFPAEARHRAIEDLAASGRINDAMRATLSFKDTKNRDVGWDGYQAALAAGLLQAGEQEWAQRFAAQITPHSGYDDHLALKNYKLGIERGDFTAARQAFFSLPNPVAHMGWLHLLVSAQMRAGDRAGATQTVRQARKLVDALPKDARKGAFHQADMAILLEEVGEAAEARQVAERLLEPRATDYAWLGIARARIDRGQITPAQEMIAKIKDDESRSKARVSLIKGFVRAGDLVAARREIDAITSDYERARGLAILAEGQARQGRWADATATIVEGRTVASRVEDLPQIIHRRSVALRDIARAQANLPDRATDTWIDALDDPQDRLAAWLGLADGLQQRITSNPSLFPEY